ncbi:MAG: type II toxin-antitoxin system HicA family toxin [Proteobacteria bacterium]|nr:type II toxin-antitoxin system HicA family toxin [Pseudomonadota bacterium]
MPELPRISDMGSNLKIFRKLGFHETRQKGSHVDMRKGDKGCVIPLHKSLAVGTLRSAIRQAGISVDEFVAAASRLNH